MTVSEIETPTVVILDELMKRNMERVQEFCDTMGYRNRPHIKTHKIPEVAKLQIETGANGITCQKLGEAEVMVNHGIDDILIYYNLLGERKLKRLSLLCKKAHITVAIDSLSVAKDLSLALQTFGGAVNVLVDCNTGYNRTGVTNPGQALELASQITQLPRLKFVGLSTFPYLPQTRDWFKQATQLFNSSGLEIAQISVGGSGFLSSTEQPVPYVTEYRAGTAIFYDRTSVLNGWAAYEDCAERIITTVVSTNIEGTVIIDAGSKTLSNDIHSGMNGYGHIIEYPEAQVVQLSEEHGHVDVSRCTDRPSLGDRLTVIPNHACGTMNLHDWAWRVSRHSGALHVIGRWDIEARGKIR